MTQKLSKKGRFSKVSLVIKAVFSLSLIGCLIWSANINELVNTLESSEKTYILFIYLTLIPAAMACTYKWMLLLRAQGIRKPNFWQLWRLYYVGMFFSNFLPTEMGGDFIRSYYVGKRSRRQLESFAAVVMERLTGLFAVVVYGIAGVFLNWRLAMEVKAIQLMLVSLATIIFGIGIFSNRRLGKWIKRKLDYQLFRSFLGKLQSLHEAFYLYRKNLGVFALAMVVSMIFQLYVICYTFCLMKCLKIIGVSFVELLLIVPAITIISILPVTINSIGLREGAFVFLFSHLGVSVSESLALALMFRLGMFIPSLVGGIIYIKKPHYGTTVVETESP